MNRARKLLFICSHNLQRSITAERIYQGFDGYEARSAGTEREARVRVSEEHLKWADIVFVAPGFLVGRSDEELRTGAAGSVAYACRI